MPSISGDNGGGIIGPIINNDNIIVIAKHIIPRDTKKLFLMNQPCISSESQTC